MPRFKKAGLPGRSEDSQGCNKTLVTRPDPKNGNPVELVRLDAKKRAVVSYIKNFAAAEEPLKGLSESEETADETRTHEITNVSLLREMLDVFKKEKVKELGVVVKCAKEPGSNISLMLLKTIAATYIIDVFKLKDLSYLNEVLLDQNIVKVMYNTNYTLKLLEKYFGCYVVNTFDLEMAAEWLKKKPSLESIVKDLIKDLTVPARVDKDWDIRPLPQINKERAIFEIKYLLLLHHHLHGLLQSSGQLGRFLNECNQFAAKVYKILDYIKLESDPAKESNKSEAVASPDAKRLKFSPPSAIESEPPLEFVPPDQSGSDEKKDSLLFEPPDKVAFFEPPDSEADKFRIDYFEIDTRENLLRMLDGFKRGATELAFNLKCSEDSKVALLLFSSSGDNFIVDVLKLGDSLAELKGIFLDPGVTKITYNADSVLKSLQNQFGLRIAGLFDIDVAARLLGYGNTSWCMLLLKSFPHLKLPRNVEYGWERRPLEEDNKICAAFEISYYPILYKLLNSELLESNKLFDLMQECYKKCDVSYLNDEDDRVKGHSNRTSKYPEKSLKFEPNSGSNSTKITADDAKTSREIFPKEDRKPETGSDVSNPMEVLKLLKNATEFLNKNSAGSAVSSEFSLGPGSFNIVDFVKTLQTAVTSIKSKTTPKESPDNCRAAENVSYDQDERLNIEPFSNRNRSETAAPSKPNYESNFYQTDVQSKISESQSSRHFGGYKEPSNFDSYSKNQSALNVKGKIVPSESNFMVGPLPVPPPSSNNRGVYDSYKNVRNIPETIVSPTSLMKTGPASNKDNKRYKHDPYDGGSSDFDSYSDKFAPSANRSEDRRDNYYSSNYQNRFDSYRNAQKTSIALPQQTFKKSTNQSEFALASGSSNIADFMKTPSNPSSNYVNNSTYTNTNATKDRFRESPSNFDYYQNVNKNVQSVAPFNSSGVKEFNYSSNYYGNTPASYKEPGNLGSYKNVHQKFVSQSSNLPDVREDTFSSGYGKNLTSNKESSNFDSYNSKNKVPNFNPSVAPPGGFAQPTNPSWSDYNVSQPRTDFKNSGRNYGNANFDYKNADSANFPHPNPGGFSRSFPDATADVRSFNSDRQRDFHGNYQNNQRSNQLDRRFDSELEPMRSMSSSLTQAQNWFRGETEQRNQTQGKRGCPFPYQEGNFKK